MNPYLWISSNDVHLRLYNKLGVVTVSSDMITRPFVIKQHQQTYIRQPHYFAKGCTAVEAMTRQLLVDLLILKHILEYRHPIGFAAKQRYIGLQPRPQILKWPRKNPGINIQHQQWTYLFLIFVGKSEKNKLYVYM